MARQIGDAVFDGDESIRRIFDAELLSRYSVKSYRSAATILAERARSELDAIMAVLRGFMISRTEIRSPGGNRMSATTRFGTLARESGFHEEVRIEADLMVKLRKGKGEKPPVIGEIVRRDFIHNHMVDFWRGRVAVDYEWNSKDQTYDRDLYAFRSFFEAGVIDVGVIVTRELSPEFFRSLGNCLDREGRETRETVLAKFGASTTGTHKLISRIAAGRSGGCPVLTVGILPANISPE